MAQKTQITSGFRYKTTDLQPNRVLHRIKKDLGLAEVLGMSEDSLLGKFLLDDNVL